MNCSRCGAELAPSARFCNACGQPVQAGQASQASPASPPVPSDSGGDRTGGVIPYKNPPALIAYYLGLFSLVPCLGILLGVASLVLGIIGLAQARKNPVIKGQVHAWIGIAGGFVALLQVVAVLLLGFLG